MILHFTLYMDVFDDFLLVAPGGEFRVLKKKKKNKPGFIYTFVSGKNKKKKKPCCVWCMTLLRVSTMSRFLLPALKPERISDLGQMQCKCSPKINQNVTPQ